MKARMYEKILFRSIQKGGVSKPGHRTQIAQITQRNADFLELILSAFICALSASSAFLPMNR